MSNQLTVFSCITGGIKDQLDILFQSKPVVQPGVKFVLFTDRLKPQTVHGATATWEVRAPVYTNINSRRTARYHKVNSHLVTDTPYSMWIDGAFEIKEGVDPLAMIQQWLATTDLATYRHPERNCVYQELDACLRLKKDDPETMRRQIDRYKTEGYPTYAGLVETACVCRRHTELIRNFNEIWWNEIDTGSLRDQLSFNYSARKAGLTWDHMGGRRDQSPYFVYHPHR